MPSLLWIRPELLDHGILHFASKSTATLTKSNVHLAVRRFREENATTNNNIQMAKYQNWQEIGREIFRWSAVEIKIFWEFLISSSPIYNPIELSSPIDDQVVPLSDLALYLYIHTDHHHHHHKTRESIDAFNAVWYDEEHAQHDTSPRSPGSAAHALRVRDRLGSDAHHLSFVREHLQDIFELLFPEASASGNMESPMLSQEDIDSLGFLIAGGFEFHVEVKRLSSLYSLWQRNEESNSAKESVWKIIRWLKCTLTVNEHIHPPTGFAKIRSVSEDISDRESGDIHEDPGVQKLHRPLVVQGVMKSTILKSSDSVFDSHGKRDLIISSCHDSFIYIPLPLRYLVIIGCTNCVIVIGAVKRVATIDLCEDLRLSIVCSRLRVSNCLDSTFFLFTTQNPILTGDNRGIHLAPYNSYYPKLEEHLHLTGFVVGDYAGKWNEFLNLEAEDSDRSNSEREAVTVLAPKAFQEICIPIKMEGSTYQNPFRLPAEYEELVKERLERIELLRRELHSEHLSFQIRKLLDIAVQANFKDWLVVSGNMRQISDLVDLYRSSKRSH